MFARMRFKHLGSVALLLGCAPVAVPGPVGPDGGAVDVTTVIDSGATDDVTTTIDSGPPDTVTTVDVPAATDLSTTDAPATDVPLAVDVPAAVDAPADVPATPCTSSRMCPGQVCDVVAGRCVDCLSTVDCTGTDVCRGNRCVPPPRACRSSRECSDLDQVCHPTRNVCVQCAGDNDCPGGFCAPDDACQPRVCTPDERTCVDAARVRACDARGSAVTETACATTETCSGGRCLPRVCTPGAADCASDGMRRTCNADGLAYTTATCPGAQVCVGGACQEGCAGGLLRCGATCVDPRGDAANCGGCGVRCGSGEVCAAGREGCMAACVPATTTTAITGTTLSARLPAGLAARATDTSGTGRGVAGEDATTGVAWLIGRTGPVTSADLAEAVIRIEGPITQLSTARSLLAGERVRLADGEEAMHERIVTTCTSATALRDRIATSLALPAPGGSAVGAGSECVVEFAVTRRASGEVLVALAVAQRTDWNTSEATARRLRDLTVFGLPQSTAMPAAVCATLRAEATAPVDIVWFQDTSASLATYQTRVARAAPAFIDGLTSAGVFARVAVMQASYVAHNLDAPGLSWVGASVTNAAYYLCDRLTASGQATCPLMTAGFTDIASPYPNSGAGVTTNEEPIAASIVDFTTLINRATAGETNVDRRVRAGARRVAIGLTDEPGSNDYTRYFQSGAAPDTGSAWGNPWSAATLANIAAWFARNNVLPFGLYPHTTTRCGASVVDLPRCTASAAGGAYADLVTTTDADIEAAMAAFAATIAADVATLRLTSVPVGGLARVTLRGVVVPRSRVDGYDIDPARRALVFRGPTYRPAAGDAVTVTYPAW